VTGFLARLAARAAGEAAGAMPRLPARFEGPAAGLPVPARGTDLEAPAPLADLEPGDRRGSTPAAKAAAAPHTAPIATGEPGGRPMAGVAVDASPPVRVRPRAGASRVPGSGTDPLGVVADAAAAIASPAPSRGGLASRGPDIAPREPRPPLAPVAALPASAAAPAESAGGRPGAPGREPDVIRVTIGRVEIRAAVPPPASRPAPTASPRPAAMPLGDYLRGRRSAG
jgi:hypothetical protein